jgi:hypothetical protein
MPSRQFSFISDALLETANAVGDHLQNHGFLLRIDHVLPAAPSVPTIYARRNKTEMVILVGSVIEMDRLKNWCAYAKSTGRDFRVAYALPRGGNLKSSDSEFMRRDGIGLLRHNGDDVSEEISPKDLGLSVSLPTLASLSKGARRHLGPAYEQFNRTQWREGFEEACQALENLARDYLIDEIEIGRVTQFIRKSGPVPALAREVRRMTLGQLSHAFTQIPNQNQTDAQLAGILPKINKDRVGVVHYKHRATTEKRLRKNIGMHMWSIIAGIKLLC